MQLEYIPTAPLLILIRSYIPYRRHGSRYGRWVPLPDRAYCRTVRRLGLCPCGKRDDPISLLPPFLPIYAFRTRRLSAKPTPYRTSPLQPTTR